MSDNAMERTYYLRTICMYMDLTKETLLQLFRYLIKSENITDFLTDLDNKKKLRELFKDDVLNKKEFNLVSSAWPDPSKFDIALLIRLIVGLCRDNISEPQRGWHSKLEPKDESLGADLLRLRNTRNNLVGHLAGAKLDEAVYIHIFTKMEAILVRIVAVFDSEGTENLRKKIIEYKDLHFETENGKVKRYLDELAESDKETKRLQTQVEELLTKSKDFKTFFKTTPERFVRYLKLLFDGGGVVLRGILERELKSLNKSLASVLSENKEMLLHSIEKENQRFLFPSHKSDDIDHSGWDVGLLASVILLLFTKLSMDEIGKIEEIKTARQNYAMYAISCLDADEFLEIWTDLISSLKHLSMGVEEEKKSYMNDLIERCKKKGSESEANDYLDQLRAANVPVKTLKGLYDETMYNLIQKLRQLKERGNQFMCEHELELKIKISCEDEGKKMEAEEALEKSLEASLRQTQGTDNFLRMETDLFMESITAHPHVKPTGVKRYCIILSFSCSTLDGIIHVLDYYRSQDFQKRICHISNEISYLFEDAFLLQAYITLDSLVGIKMEDCEEVDDRKGLSLPLKCSSVEGMEHILEALQNERTVNTLNSVADKISDELQETVEIQVSSELFEFKDAFDDAGKSSHGFSSKGRKTDEKDPDLSLMTETEKQKQETHSSPEASSNETDDHTHLDRMMKRLSEIRLTEDHVLQLDEAETSLQEMIINGTRVTTLDLIDLQTSIERIFQSQINSSSSNKREPRQLQDPDSVHQSLTIHFSGLTHLVHRPLFTRDKDEYVERLKCLYQDAVAFKRRILPKIMSKDAESRRMPVDTYARERNQDDYQSNLHDFQDVRQRDGSFKQHSSEEIPYKISMVDDTHYLDRMLGELSEIPLSSEHVWQLHKAENSLRDIENIDREVTRSDLIELQTTIDGIFHSIVDDSPSNKKKQSLYLQSSNQNLQRRRQNLQCFHCNQDRFNPIYTCDKEEYLQRLTRIYQDFVQYKRYIMPYITSEIEVYQRGKQELKYYLLETGRNTLKERGFRKRISLIPCLMSPREGNIKSYQGIFYEFQKRHKHIFIIGDKSEATFICSQLISAWCEAQTKGNFNFLREFELVFTASLSDVISGVTIQDMIKCKLPSWKYIQILEQVLLREPEKCLVILDGLDEWRLNASEICSTLEILRGNLLTDYVTITTASRHLKTRLKKLCGDDHLLYIY